MKDEKGHYSKEWQILRKLADGYGLQDLKSSQLDASLNRKINWFLFNGAGGVISMIREIYGDEALQEFYSFLNYFVSEPDTPGHYHHSDKINDDISLIRTNTEDLDFEKYLKQLKKELIEQDKEKGK